jgi:hypothetical protein
MSSHPSVRLHWTIGSHWMDSHEISYSSIFSQIRRFIKVRKEQRVLYMEAYVHMWQYLARFFLEWEMFQTKIVQKIKTHFVFNHFLRQSCPVLDNEEKCGGARQATDDNIIRRMRFERWITNATSTHSECVILLAFPRQQWLRERTSMLRWYIHCLCCVASIRQRKCR